MPPTQKRPNNQEFFYSILHLNYNFSKGCFCVLFGIFCLCLSFPIKSEASSFIVATGKLRLCEARLRVFGGVSIRGLRRGRGDGGRMNSYKLFGGTAPRGMYDQFK